MLKKHYKSILTKIQLDVLKADSETTEPTQEQYEKIEFLNGCVFVDEIQKATLTLIMEKYLAKCTDEKKKKGVKEAQELLELFNLTHESQ